MTKQFVGKTKITRWHLSKFGDILFEATDDSVFRGHTVVRHRDRVFSPPAFFPHSFPINRRWKGFPDRLSHYFRREKSTQGSIFFSLFSLFLFFFLSLLKILRIDNAAAVTFDRIGRSLKTRKSCVSSPGINEDERAILNQSNNVLICLFKIIIRRLLDD